MGGAHFLHWFALDPLLVEDDLVFGEPTSMPTVFPRAAVARPVVVGTVPGVRVAVAAASGLPTRYAAGLEAALEEKPERLQFRLERVVLLRVRRIGSAPAIDSLLDIDLGGKYDR